MKMFYAGPENEKKINEIHKKFMEEKNKLTSLLKIRFPIIVSGIPYISGWEMAA